MPMPKGKETTRCLNFRLPLPILHELERRSEMERMSRNQIAVRALEAYLKQPTPTP
jgi:hypothetical protein